MGAIRPWHVLLLGGCCFLIVSTVVAIVLAVTLGRRR